MTEQIAKITSTFLGYEDHGIFSVNLNFDYGDSFQGTGHYGIDGEAAANFIQGVLRACGVDQWEKLVGRTVFVLKDDGWSGQVRGLKPLPTECGSEFLITDSFPKEVAA